MRYLLLLVSLNCSIFLFSQQQSAINRSEWNKLAQLSSEYLRSGKYDPNTLQQFPVYRLRGGLYVSVFGRQNAHPDWEYARTAGILKGSVTGNVATCKVPLEQFAQLDFSRIYTYVELPQKAVPHLDRAVKDTRADSVQQGIGLPEAFTGKDVFIGITDWGFDYTHPTFYDTLLDHSRIFAAWDQFRTAGTMPVNYNYGVEFDTPGELHAAGSDTANIYSYHYHGTHVAGITGGSGAGKPYRGFGFESEFLFATFLVDAASAIDAFNWMKDKAEQQDKRLVINMSWGLTYMGTLDGNSLLSEAIAELAAGGVVFVGSAGNNGNVNYHIKKTFNSDDFQSRINFYSYSSAANNWGQSITMWGEESKPFSAGLRIYNTSGTLLNQTPVYSTLTQTTYVDSILVIGNDTLFFNLAAENANPLNQRPNMRLRVKNRFASYYVVLYSSADEGTVHYWNVTELTTGVGNWGAPLTGYGTNSVSGDAKYSIGEPACSPDVITVAAYAASYIAPSGSPTGGSLASFSSCGPLYNGTMKPDIAAPGFGVISSISSYTDQGPSTIGSADVAFNGRTYTFGSLSGTSMSSPCVAGIVSLMLDANPALSPAEIKTIIKTTARTDNYTGMIAAPGHERWGMGKINAYAAVTEAVAPLLSQPGLSTLPGMVIFPNPTADKLHILLPFDLQPSEATIITMTGSVIRKSINDGVVELGDLPGGYYIIEVISGEQVFRKSVILN